MNEPLCITEITNHSFMLWVEYSYGLFTETEIMFDEIFITLEPIDVDGYNYYPYEKILRAATTVYENLIRLN